MDFSEGTMHSISNPPARIASTPPPADINTPSFSTIREEDDGISPEGGNQLVSLTYGFAPSRFLDEVADYVCVCDSGAWGSVPEL
ncbi:MAG: hypothetical protein Q9213_004519 [Squamulea squamosa]